jgi:hypothetical protein
MCKAFGERGSGDILRNFPSSFNLIFHETLSSLHILPGFRLPCLYATSCCEQFCSDDHFRIGNRWPDRDTPFPGHDPRPKHECLHDD